MVLAYQIVFLDSVHAVICVCIKTTYCELKDLGSVLHWMMWTSVLSVPDRQRLQENLFLYYFHVMGFGFWGFFVCLEFFLFVCFFVCPPPPLFFFMRETKDVFGRASVCCFV